MLTSDAEEIIEQIIAHIESVPTLDFFVISKTEPYGGWKKAALELDA